MSMQRRDAARKSLDLILDDVAADFPALAWGPEADEYRWALGPDPDFQAPAGPGPEPYTSEDVRWAAREFAPRSSRGRGAPCPELSDADHIAIHGCA